MRRVVFVANMSEVRCPVIGQRYVGCGLGFTFSSVLSISLGGLGLVEVGFSGDVQKTHVALNRRKKL